MEKKDKTCKYQFEWSFVENIESLVDGDKINIELNYNRQEHFCGQKRVYGMATGSNKVLQIPNYDYDYNSNIKYIEGTGHAHTWYDEYESQSYILEVDIDQPRSMTSFSIQTGPHRIFYVYEYDQNAIDVSEQDLSKVKASSRSQAIDPE